MPIWHPADIVSEKQYRREEESIIKLHTSRTTWISKVLLGYFILKYIKINVSKFEHGQLDTFMGGRYILVGDTFGGKYFFGGGFELLSYIYG